MADFDCDVVPLIQKNIFAAIWMYVLLRWYVMDFRISYLILTSWIREDY